MSSEAFHDRTILSSPVSRYELLSFILLLLILAWAPFPLGSNRPWAWSLLSLLIASSWLLWSVSAWQRPDTTRGLAHGLLIPWILALLALAWGVVQVLPIVPQAWVHPAWGMAAQALGKPLDGVISLSPWRTVTEVMKLGSYLMVAWLAR